MIGQEKLLNKIQEYSIDNFPRSILLLGELGCGKHTLAKIIAEDVLHLPFLDFTSNVSDDYIDAIYRNPNPTVYMLDLSKLVEKDQNTILKLVEEPLKNSFIVLIAETRTTILPTVINRCVYFDFEPYTKEQLIQFVPEGSDAELCLSFLRTPGKIINSNTKVLSELVSLCDKIVSKISLASYPNTLSIIDKLNFEDQYDKFDPFIFLDCLEMTMFSQYRESNNNLIYQMYELTRDQRKILGDKRINKEMFFRNFFTKLWKLAKGI